MAALDTLILGPFVFTDFAIPEKMNLGGRQQMKVHRMVGGARTIDNMGPDDEDRSWSGFFWGPDALSQAQTLDALRIAGQELAFSWGGESRTVVIAEFKYDVEKFQKVNYSIIVVTSDTSGTSGPTTSLDSLVMAALSNALALVP